MVRLCYISLIINIVKYLLHFISLFFFLIGCILLVFLDYAYFLFDCSIWCIPFPQILLNEVAPRPHNSGHHTIESCYTSQFEQHLRAVVGLPLGDPSMKTPAAIMYNLLGEDEVHTFVFLFLLFSNLYESFGCMEFCLSMLLRVFLSSPLSWT